MITLCCCAASNARSSAALSLKAERDLGSGLVRLVRKFAISEINPLMITLAHMIHGWRSIAGEKAQEIKRG